MDEKTADLRDLFVETTGRESVTERQAERRGTLPDGDDEGAVRAVVATMRERYAFTTALDDEALVAVVRGVHDGRDDAALAADLGVDAALVADARFDLHLVRDADREPPAGADAAALRRLAAAGASLSEAAAAVDADPAATARPYRAALADAESRRANSRFRDEFAALVADADLSGRLTDMDDGLREATEDIETDVSL
ncbi:MAG: hypothetical protein A07HB70_01336 [uncultured archaeon A07HB70]|nr:MAG: hypothetical protein A07HB70_01336 [uncultured archaeon A07HB70]